MDWAILSRKCASIFAQNAPNMSIYSNIRRECSRTDLRGSAVGDRTREIPIAEWERIYRKEPRARRLLHQARVLSWEKRKGIATLASYHEVICRLS
jgi:hypothetical protein